MFNRFIKNNLHLIIIFFIITTIIKLLGGDWFAAIIISSFAIYLSLFKREQRRLEIEYEKQEEEKMKRLIREVIEENKGY